MRPPRIYLAAALTVLALATACKSAPPSRARGPWKGPAFRNPDLSHDERIADLLAQLTVDEKIQQLNYASPGVERLGILPYNWWNEALHGVARNGRATVFPQALALAATFDTALAHKVASAISDEARAKFAMAQSLGNFGRYAGLTFWTPNINIFRDPRWGRGQETYGEDPYLTSRMGVAFVKGLQGDDPKYLKAAACAKHFAVHSGPEVSRHEFNAEPSKKDLYETYLPAFEALVREAKVESVMSAYNRLYGVPAGGSPFLLQEILRKRWGFKGHVVSDCWALQDFHGGHKVTSTEAESAAMALRAGVNLNCGDAYRRGLPQALEQKLVTEAQINKALVPLLRTRFKLGLFDPPGANPYDRIDQSVVGSKAHQDLAREAAAKSIVLLKNNGVLPLNKKGRGYFLVGPYVADGNVLLGNYHGAPDRFSTLLEGVTSHVTSGTEVGYRYAFLPDRPNVNPLDWSTGEAHNTDAIIVTLGISPLLEGEEGESVASPERGDRGTIGLPENQVAYLKQLKKAGKVPIIAVLFGGSALAAPEVHELADAVLMAWYPGQEGGDAIADVLFGDVSPSGRLPITFPMSDQQLPPFDNYDMAGRTYRYMTQTPLYPFGFGLSYSRFTYRNLKLASARIGAGQDLDVEVTVINEGDREAQDVVQLYVTALQPSTPGPQASLVDFSRINLNPGEWRLVKMKVPAKSLQTINQDGKAAYDPSSFRVTVGAASPGERAFELGAPKSLTATFDLVK